MPITELEGVILGIVHSRGVCSTYAIRRRFEQSPTWGWSSSKGSIYPAVRRLTARGLLVGAQSRETERGTELLQITATGKHELAAWITALTPEMGGAPVDPIRTRVNYLGALVAKDRNTFLAAAEKSIRDALDRASAAENDPLASDNWTLHATALGIQLQLQAKLRWIEELRKLPRSRSFTDRSGS
ncbi:PadR family transcriptional regulator [Sphingomonas sinipercae]